MRKSKLKLGGAIAALAVFAAGSAGAEAVFVTNGPAIDEYSLTGQFIRAITAPDLNSVAFTPTGLAFGADGRLYAGDRVGHDLAVFDPGTGAYLGRVGSIAPNDASVAISGLARAPNGNIVGLTNQDQLFIIDPNANTTQLSQIDILNSACCATFLAIGADGEIIGSNNSDDAIYDISDQTRIAQLQPDVTGVTFSAQGQIFALNGTTVEEISGDTVTPFATSSALIHSGGGGDLAFDSAGDLWVTGASEDQLVEFSSSGALIRSFCAAANGGASCGGNAGFLAIGPDVIPTGGVPEPAIWALMIGGFAGVGAQLRRRRDPARA